LTGSPTKARKKNGALIEINAPLFILPARHICLA
jgi:hypothetical protein